MLDPYNYLTEERLDEAKGDATAEYKKLAAIQKQADAARNAYLAGVDSMIGGVANAIRKAGMVNNLGRLKVDVKRINHDDLGGEKEVSTAASLLVQGPTESIMVGVSIFRGYFTSLRHSGKNVSVRTARNIDDVAIQILQELGWIQ
jgi:hypothetical protein